jgi:hypothetical protein
MRDLSRDERILLRALSILDAFDKDLASHRGRFRPRAGRYRVAAQWFVDRLDPGARRGARSGGGSIGAVVSGIAPHSVRNSGRYDEAQLVYEQIARHSASFAQQARLQLADLHLLRGQFTRALTAVDQLAESALLGEAGRIRGHAWRTDLRDRRGDDSPWRTVRHRYRR